MKKIIGILLGLASIVIGIVMIVSHFKIQKVQTAETSATIIRVDSEVETDSDGFDTRYYYPVIEYTVEEKKYETRLANSGSTNSTEYNVGNTINIKYNPDNPTEISQKGSNAELFGGIFFAIIGLGATCASLFGKF